MRHFGSYLIFLWEMLVRPEGFRVLFKLFIDECIKTGYNSLFIVALVSTFTGAVSGIQTFYNLSAPYLQDYIMALVVRDMNFAMIPTLTALVYAGKVGSFISGELGTMRITEQIDALEVMGINATSYLVLPKVIASLIMFPMLVVLACTLALLGGYWALTFPEFISPQDYIRGIRYDFNPFIVVVILTKSVAYGFLVASISAYNGFFTRGGALEVGQSSTKAVIACCIFILSADFLITKLMLN